MSTNLLLPPLDSDRYATQPTPIFIPEQQAATQEEATEPLPPDPVIKHLADHNIGLHLIKRINAGGEGCVYLGQETVYVQTEHGMQEIPTRPVAIKMNPVTVNNHIEGNDLRRLRRHPHIQDVYHFGREERNEYDVTVMPVAKGSLKDYLTSAGRNTVLKPVENMQYLGQIGSALQFAHNNNTIHRDVKPANVLYDGRGRLLLSDFGAAVAIDPSNARERTERWDTLTGTPGYTAPEQVHQEPTVLSDQYSLAAMAYRLYAGVEAFPDNKDALQKLFYGLHHDIQPFPDRTGRANTDMQAAVEATILKGMNRDQYRRFTSVTAFIEALENGVADHLTGSDRTAHFDDVSHIASRQLNRLLADSAVQRGETHSADGDYLQALNAYDEAIQLEPTTLAAYYHKARILDRTEAAQSARETYEKVIDMPERSARDIAFKGHAYARLQNLEGASRAFTDAAGFYDIELQDLLAEHVTNGVTLASMTTAEHKRLITLNDDVRRTSEYAGETATMLIAQRLKVNDSRGAEKLYQNGLMQYNRAIRHAGNPDLVSAIKAKKEQLLMVYTDQETVRVPVALAA